jgi:branched-chain amino acid transport system permease protein
VNVVGADAGVYLTNLIGGLGSGSVLFLVASGLTLIFGALRVLNFAHGGLVLLGMYFTYELQNAIGWSNPLFWVVMLLASVAVGLCGLVLEVGFFRPIYRRPLLTQLIVTFSFALIIAGVVRYQIGGGGTTTHGPPPFLRDYIQIGTGTVSYFKLTSIAVAIAVAIGMWAMLYKTGLGRMIRAAVSDPELLALSGVNVRWLFTGVFVIAATLAGFAGSILTFEGSFNANAGSVIIEAFIVVVIGGLGSISGAFIGALLITVFEALVTAVFSSNPQLQSLLSIGIVYLILVVVLAVRPQGLRGSTA